METLEIVLNYFGIECPEKSPYEIEGKDRNDLAALFGQLGYKTGAEVGVYRGVYSEIICKANPTVKHYCIDQYRRYINHPKQEDLNGAEEEAFRRLSPYNAHFIKEPSVQAAERFENASLDYVYIDANHEFPFVVSDLNSWVRKVRSGGIVAGHDFYISSWSRSVLHVAYAVTGWTQSYKIDPWFVLGSKKDLKDDWSKRYRTWFWVVK